jgi:hypothetical protein
MDDDRDELMAGALIVLAVAVAPFVGALVWVMWASVGGF